MTDSQVLKVNIVLICELDEEIHVWLENLAKETGFSAGYIINVGLECLKDLEIFEDACRDAALERDKRNGGSSDVEPKPEQS